MAEEAAEKDEVEVENEKDAIKISSQVAIKEVILCL